MTSTLPRLTSDRPQTASVRQRSPRGRWSPVDVALLVDAAAFVALVTARGSITWGAVRAAVVVALATVAFLAVRRGSPRMAGWTSVAAGLAGVIIGLAIGVSFAARSGWSAMAVAGLAALLAGLVLVGAGTRALVHHARGWRKWLALPIGFVVLQFAGVPLFGAVVITNVPPDAVASATPADRGLRYEDVTFATDDGVELSAWYVPSTNRAAVVVLAGSGSTRSDVLDHAAVIARHGFGTLIMDNRGHGRSGGIAMDTGWFGDLDIGAAVRLLQSRPDVDPAKIAVVGLSMGGEEALGAAASNPGIRAVVAEGATGRDAADLIDHPGGLQGPIETLTSWTQFRVADLLTDASTPIPLREAAAATAPRPVLLIAGVGEEEANRRFQAAAPSSTDLWETGSGHVAGFASHPAEWEQRVTDFLARALHVDPS
jgi:fermentation-respiration switch protein FrsA (DUF1100 family)